MEIERKRSLLFQHSKAKDQRMQRNCWRNIGNQVYFFPFKAVISIVCCFAPYCVKSLDWSQLTVTISWGASAAIVTCIPFLNSIYISNLSFPRTFNLLWKDFFLCCFIIYWLILIHFYWFVRVLHNVSWSNSPCFHKLFQDPANFWIHQSFVSYSHSFLNRFRMICIAPNLPIPIPFSPKLVSFPPSPNTLRPIYAAQILLDAWASIDVLGTFSGETLRKISLLLLLPTANNYR